MQHPPIRRGLAAHGGLAPMIHVWCGGEHGGVIVRTLEFGGKLTTKAGQNFNQVSWNLSVRPLFAVARRSHLPFDMKAPKLHQTWPKIPLVIMG